MTPDNLVEEFTSLFLVDFWVDNLKDFISDFFFYSNIYQRRIRSTRKSVRRGSNIEV